MQDIMVHTFGYANQSQADPKSLIYALPKCIGRRPASIHGAFRDYLFMPYA